jgi:hypothetical protein
MESIYRQVEASAVPEIAAEVAELREVELFSFDNAEIPGVCKWEIGVPSGLKWTAVVDSILNRAAAEIVAEDIGFKIESAYYQGDDAILMGLGPSDSNVWADAYAKLGLDVNRDKTWVSRDSCDFLHEVYRAGEIRAFPARMGKSVIWKKPSQGGAVVGAETRLHECISDCLKGVRRDLIGCRDVARRLVGKFMRTRGCIPGLGVVDELLDTPTWMGGLGFGEHGRLVLQCTGGEVELSRYTLTSPSPSIPSFVLPAIVSRLSASAFMRVRPLLVDVVAIKGLSATDDYRSVGDKSSIKTDFVVQDRVPWLNQLLLTCALSGAQKLRSAGQLPDARLRAMGLRAGFAALCFYKRIVKKASFTIETAVTTAESYLFGADWSHRHWQNMCTFWALEQRSRKGSFWEECALYVRSALLNYMLEERPCMLVRV